MSIKDTLNTFGRRVQQQARANLTRGNHKASGELYKATKYELSVSPNSFTLRFDMPEYWQYQDQGVSGTQKKYNTPFKYTTKKPPAKVFEGWAKQKGIKPRDKNGRFRSYRSFGFAVANSIFRRGIKPTKFFSKPFENEFEKLPSELVEAYSLEINNLLKFTTS